MLEWLDGFVRRMFLRNLHLKVIAALLTMALYLWVSVDREVERTRHAPMRIDVPQEMVLVNDPPDRVRVTVRGTWSDLSRLESPQLDEIRIQIDQSMGQRGRIPLSPDMIDLPPGLRALDIEPNSVAFRLEERQHKSVRLQPNVVGEPADGFHLSEITISPEEINISGPARAVDEISSVATEPVEVTGRTEPFRREVRPRIEDALVTHDLDEPIVVEVDIDARQVERTIAELGVEPVGIDASLVHIVPGSVDVTVRGPKTLLDQLARETLFASLDLSDEQPDRPRMVEREVEIRNLPDGVELISKQPKIFRIHLRAEQEPDAEN